MALIKCPECGTEVSSSAVACPKCAFPIDKWIKEQEKEQENQKEAAVEAVEYVKKEQARKKREQEQAKQYEERNEKIKAVLPKIIVVVLICVVIGILAPVIYDKIIIPNQKYQSALSMMKSEDYNSAIKMLKELGDGEKYAEKIRECYYLRGEYHLSKNDYANAAVSFEEAGDYRDSKEKLETARNELDKVENEKTLRKARDLLNQGDYASAESMFNSLRNKGYQIPDDIEDEIAYEVEYQAALEKGLKSLKLATEALNKLPYDYKNVSEILQASEKLLKYEGLYTSSGDFGDKYCNYDFEFWIKLFLNSSEDVLVRVERPHAFVHDKNGEWDTESYNQPIVEKTYQIKKDENGDYCFIPELDILSDDPSVYTMTFKDEEILISNNQETYHATKAK